MAFEYICFMSESTILRARAPTLYSSRPVRMQIFCTLVIKAKYTFIKDINEFPEQRLFQKFESYVVFLRSEFSLD